MQAARIGEISGAFSGGGGGKGGGGGAPVVPTESPNTLRSKAVARVIDVISEGESEGLYAGAQSIFFDGTPLENEDGTRNFGGIKYDVRKGLTDQEPFSGNNAVETERGVGVKVTVAAPVIKTITDVNVNAIRLTVRIPSLFSQSLTTGDVSGAQVEFRIEAKPSGGVYAVPVEFSRSTSFIGQASTGANATGVSVTVQNTTTGVGRAETQTVTAEYRLVGSGTWLSLGTATKEITNTVTTISTGGGNSFATSTSTGPTTWSQTFSAVGLTQGDYEVRATAGIIVAQNTVAPTTIIISGKTTSPYEEGHRFVLASNGFPWDIRVTRVTPDSTSGTLSNDLFFSRYTELIEHKLIMPDTAAIQIEADSALFGGKVAKRAYDWKGIKVQVPSNYDPITRTYTGFWDGTFKMAWTDNPAWIFYDLVTNRRYGLGAFIDATQVDKFSLYAIAQYNDGLVNDGFGNLEPRFTFNGVLTTREDAISSLQAIASTFRGMVYWSAGVLTAMQDSPKMPVKIVTNANVIGGAFNYSGASLESRHTVALVSWNDPAEGGKRRVETVEDQSSIAKFGFRQTEVFAIGTTRKSQAHRVGKWILDSEKNETEIVQYSASFDHADVVPGDIISLLDANEAGVRFGGRVRSATLSDVTLDAPLTLISGDTYRISIVFPSRLVTFVPGDVNVTTDQIVATAHGADTGDGPVQVTTDDTLPAPLVAGTSYWIIAIDAYTIQLATSKANADAGVIIDLTTAGVGTHTLRLNKMVVEERDVTNVLPYTGDILTVATNWPEVPKTSAMYGITAVTTISPQQFRVLAVGQKAANIFEVTALEYDSTKFARVEADLKVSGTPFTVLTGNLKAPTSLTTMEFLAKSGAILTSNVTVSWEASPDLRIIKYEVQVKRPGESDWHTVAIKPAILSLDLANVFPGSWGFRVRGLDFFDTRSPWLSNDSVVLFGIAAPPADVMNYVSNIVGDISTQSWDAVGDLDLDHYTLRFSPLTSGATWGGAQILIAKIAANSTTVQVPAIVGTYMIKAVDASGTESLNATLIVNTNPGASALNVVQTEIDEPTFAGVKTNLAVTGSLLQLVSGSTSGTYIFAGNPVNLGGVFTSRITANLQFTVSDNTNTLDTWTTLAGIGFMNNTDQSKGQAKLQIRTTQTDPAGTPVWSAWQDFFVGDYPAWGIEFQLLVTAQTSNIQISVSTLQVTVDMPDRIERGNDVLSLSTGPTNITFSPDFKTLKAVVITGQNMATGDYATVTGKAVTGFTVDFFNSAAARKAITFDWVAVGFGKKDGT